MQNLSEFLSSITKEILTQITKLCGFKVILGGIKPWQLLIDRSCRNMEIYKWKWIVLGALDCFNNADIEKKIVYLYVSLFLPDLSMFGRKE